MDPRRFPLTYNENHDQSQYGNCLNSLINLTLLKIPPLKLSSCFWSFVGKIDNKNNNKAMCTVQGRHVPN